MIELPALIDDELTAELDTVNDQYDEKDQEQDALEDVHSRSMRYDRTACIDR